jgi:hypothetical protein
MTIASVTAGLTWAPLTGPKAYATKMSTKPNATATAMTPADLRPATAAPTAMRTSRKVPMNSATSLRLCMGDPPIDDVRTAP